MERQRGSKAGGIVPRRGTAFWTGFTSRCVPPSRHWRGAYHGGGSPIRRRPSQPVADVPARPQAALARPYNHLTYKHVGTRQSGAECNATRHIRGKRCGAKTAKKRHKNIFFCSYVNLCSCVLNSCRRTCTGCHSSLSGLSGSPAKPLPRGPRPLKSPWPWRGPLPRKPPLPWRPGFISLNLTSCSGVSTCSILAF